VKWLPLASKKPDSLETIQARYERYRAYVGEWKQYEDLGRVWGSLVKRKRWEMGFTSEKIYEYLSPYWQLKPSSVMQYMVMLERGTGLAKLVHAKSEPGKMPSLPIHMQRISDVVAAIGLDTSTKELFEKAMRQINPKFKLVESEVPLYSKQ
jgi:hypothetical protein